MAPGKRRKASGAQFRKKKRLQAEFARRHQGALLKYFAGTSTGRENSTGAEETSDAAAINVFDTIEGTVSASGLQDDDDLASSSSQDQPCRSSTPDARVTTLADLTDIGSWPSFLTDETRVAIVRKGSSKVQNVNYRFPRVARQGCSTKGRERSLTREWFYRVMPNGEKVLRTWLAYSPSKQALFCFCCRLFPHRNQLSGFGSAEGFNQWWKLNPKVGLHEASVIHNTNFMDWKEMELRLADNTVLDSAAQALRLSERRKWKDLLLRLLDIIMYLAKQSLPLRGHRESIACLGEAGTTSVNQGNFLELVRLLGKYDPVLREHITRNTSRGKNSVSYLSATIQNEFVEVLGGKVREKILAQVKNAKYYSIILDSTPDLAHKDQTSQILRYVSIEDNGVKIEESFVDFLETEGKDAESILQMILQKLEADGLDIQDCRGQAYDNAAVMSGRHSGLQARIRAINHQAMFVGCANHTLNLACVHAASVSVNSITFFGILENLFVFFSASPHRWSALTAITGSVKRVIDTRWSSRGDAVNAVYRNFDNILEVLEQLTSANENYATVTDAAVLLNALRSFSFISFLGFWKPVLEEINDTQRYLQTKGLAFDQCDAKLKALKIMLADGRSDLIDKAFSYANEKCEELGIDKHSKRPRRSEPGSSFEAHLQKEMCDSLEGVLLEVTKRFEAFNQLASRFSFLEPRHLLNEEFDWNLDFEDINAEEFMIERNRLRHFMKVAAEEGSYEANPTDSLELLEFIVKLKLTNSLPNIVVMLRIHLAMPVSVASCERSFSKMKLIKTYLRANMLTPRLSNLAILSIENSVAQQIDFEDLIDDFAARKVRRIPL